MTGKRATRTTPTILGAKSAAVNRLRIKAERLRREGDIDAAFEAYQDAVALAPDNPELLMVLARVASQLEMHDVAVQLWARVSLAAPTDATVCDGYARALIAAARFAEAIDLLKSMLKVQPEQARLWTTLGLALTHAGRSGEALTFLGEGIRLNPRSPSAICYRGLALLDLKRFEEAETDFLAAAKLVRKASKREKIELSLATTTFADLTPSIRAAADEMRNMMATSNRLSSPKPTADASTGASLKSESRVAQRRRGDQARKALKFVCVLRSGGDYAPSHVERLQRQLARRLPGAELTCLSDVDVPCERIGLRQDWSGVRGWWAKMELFAPWVEGDLLFFDLDTSLVGDLSDIAAVRSLTLLQDFNFSAYASSGLMFLPEADRSQIWETFSRDPQHWIHYYDDANRKDARWGDQGFLWDHGLARAQRWQAVVPEQIYSYKVHDLARAGMPPNARVICFHGLPRPWSPGVAAEFQGD